MSSPIPQSGFLYGYVVPGASGKMMLQLTRIGEPPAGTVASLVLRGVLPEGMTMNLDIVSDASLAGLAGPPGSNGWTPVLVGEPDGTRTVVHVVDWVRSSGKPAVGYVGPAGSSALVEKAADAFNFNAIKRVFVASGSTNASGIATIVFGAAFTTVPQVVMLPPQPAVVVGGSKAELVAGSLTKDGCQIKVTGAALLSSTVVALLGATASVFVVET